MENFRIEVKETKNYWQRIRFGVIVTVIILTVAAVAILTMKEAPSFAMVFVMYLGFIGLIFYSSNRTAGYFITVFEIKEGILHIEYKKRNERKIAEGNVENFIFSEGFGGRGSPMFFEIRYVGAGRILRQSQAWEWKEPFNELMRYLIKNKLLNNGPIWFLSRK